MFLIGQYDSPFVRRVAIAMRLYGLAFDHKPWSTFGDADKIAPYNPLRRVPTLVLDSGEALIESHIILDYLDELVGEAKAMIPPHGAERRRHLRICALATGSAKSARLVDESALRKEQLKLGVERHEAQVSGALDVLEQETPPAKTRVLVGERIGHSASRWPACCASPPKRIRISITPRAIRRCQRMPRAPRRCRRSRKSCSRWRHRRGRRTVARMSEVPAEAGHPAGSGNPCRV